MFIEVLVNDRIEAGAAILNAIESAGVPVSSAFWCRMPDGGFWRLVIASRLVDRVGPLKGYQRLQKIFQSAGLDSRLFAEVAFLSPSDPEFLRLREHAIGPGNIRVGRSPGARALASSEDAFVYVA